MKNIIILMISGILCGLSFAPFFFLPGILLISTLSFNVYNAKSLKSTFIRSLIWGYGYYSATLYWIASALSKSPGQDLSWLIPIVFILIPLALSLTIVLQSIVTKIIHQKLNSNFTLIFSCVWLIKELLISFVLTGFPWALIGYSVSFSDVLSQIANIVGVYGISFLLVYIASGFYLLWIKDFKSLKTHIYISIMLILCVVVYGKISLSNNPTELTNLKVRIIQPSIAITQKFTKEAFRPNLDIHINLSNQDLDFKPDIIIWPEDAVITSYKHQNVLTYITDSLKSFDGLLMTGGLDQVDGRYYNAFYAIDNNAKLEFMYHKQHLVPFGEYMPFKKILAITKITEGIEDFAVGTTVTSFHLNKINLHVIPLICYESVFPSEVSKKASGGDVIIISTFDTWFGDSSGPYQHFYMAKIRAIENGVPVLRAANNGISAIIDSGGRILSISKLNEVTKVDGLIPKKLKHSTIYNKYYHSNIIVCKEKYIFVFYFLCKILH